MGAVAAIAGRVLAPLAGRVLSGGAGQGPSGIMSMMMSNAPGGQALQLLTNAAGSGLTGPKPGDSES